MANKFSYSQGLTSYGLPGKDGSLGLSGLSFFVSDLDSLTNQFEIKNKILDNENLIFLNHNKIDGYPARVYQNGDLFIDINSKICVIDFSNPNLYYISGIAFASSSFFTTGIPTPSLAFQRYYNLPAAGAGKLVDFVYSTQPPLNYAQSISSIYGLGSEDYIGINYSGNALTSNNINTYNIWIGNVDPNAPNENSAIALVRETGNNNWRLGNLDNLTSKTQRSNTLTLDFAWVKTNDASITNIENSNLTTANINSTNITVGNLLNLSTTGLKFPDNAFGGGGDTAGIRLISRGGENQSLEIYVTNDATDWINFSAQNHDAVKVNNFTIWNAGNLNLDSVDFTADTGYFNVLNTLEVDSDLIPTQDLDFVLGNNSQRWSEAYIFDIYSNTLDTSYLNTTTFATSSLNTINGNVSNLLNAFTINASSLSIFNGTAFIGGPSGKLILDYLTPSQILMTNSSNNVISVAQGSAFNTNFATNTEVLSGVRTDVVVSPASLNSKTSYYPSADFLTDNSTFVTPKYLNEAVFHWSPMSYSAETGFSAISDQEVYFAKLSALVLLQFTIQVTVTAVNQLELFYSSASYGWSVALPTAVTGWAYNFTTSTRFTIFGEIAQTGGSIYLVVRKTDGTNFTNGHNIRFIFNSNIIASL